MAQDIIVRGVTYSGVEKLSLPVSGGSALFRDTSEGDAVAGDVLSGKKAFNASGEISGSMPNQGAASGTISDKDTPFQIPQGYHNGSGSVEIAAAQKALLVPGNIRDSVTILGVTGDYTGGGGGPTSADAILIVTAPSGSTVTATKGGTTLSPTLWTTAADANFECALFVIGSSLFDSQNPWTVTATDGVDTDSETIIVDSNKEYTAELSYTYYLYNNGDECAAITGGWTVAIKNASAANAIKAATFIQLNGIPNTTRSNRYATCYTTNAINLTDFSTIKVLYESWNPGSSYGDPFGEFKFGEAAQSSSFTSYNMNNIQGTSITSATAEATLSFDVSTLTGSFYVGGMIYMAGVKIYKVWLE